jgi:hypothetical protein
MPTILVEESHAWRCATSVWGPASQRRRKISRRSGWHQLERLAVSAPGLPVVAPHPGKPVVVWLTDRPVVALPLSGGYRSTLACWPGCRQRWLVRAESWASSKGFDAAAWEIPAHLNGCIRGSLRVRYAADAHRGGVVGYASGNCATGALHVLTNIHTGPLGGFTHLDVRLSKAEFARKVPIDYFLALSAGICQLHPPPSLAVPCYFHPPPWQSHAISWRIFRGPDHRSWMVLKRPFSSAT